VRFLVHNALSPAVAAALASAGHDAVHVRDHNMHAATDSEVFERAPRVPLKQVEVVLTNLQTIAPHLEEGSVVVFDRARVRIRRLPFQRP
jgi:predicted nuclease of predicted toxin-antitoxin system